MISARSFDRAIVGAGFGGLYALYRLHGLGFDVGVYDAGSGIGGSWFSRRYPSTRCDIDRMHTRDFKLEEIELAIRRLTGEIPGDESIHSCLIPER